jgi:hypothetical protein
MLGLAPGIFVIASAAKQSIHQLCRAMDCFAPLAMTSPWLHGNSHHFFIIFVDGMFTTFIVRLFTNTSHVLRQKHAISCV